MTKDGRVYKFDEPRSALMAAEIPNEYHYPILDNGSTTDTFQWCELHCGHCHDVVPVRRCFTDPNRKSEMFMACQNCLRDLKKAKVAQDSKYAGLECYEIVVPAGLSKGESLEPSFTHPQERSKADRSLLRSRQQSYEVTLDALQVKYLRALGLRVIKA